MMLATFFMAEQTERDNNIEASTEQKINSRE